MIPYFETQLGKLYCGDCLEIMKELGDKSVDLVLTDPPYGTGRDKQSMGRGGGIAKHINYGVYNWDDIIPQKETFKEMFRVSKNQIIFGGNYFVEYLKNSPCWIVWDKDNGLTDFADCELAWTSFNSAVRRLKYRWSGMLQENMKDKEKRYHPTQKPIALMKWILQKYSNENDIILDPFLGSGTTAVAYEMLNRKWIGIEISEEYCAIAKTRIKAEADQLKLYNK